MRFDFCVYVCVYVVCVYFVCVYMVCVCMLCVYILCVCVYGMCVCVCVCCVCMCVHILFNVAAWISNICSSKAIEGITCGIHACKVTHGHVHETMHGITLRGLSKISK